MDNRHYGVSILSLIAAEGLSIKAILSRQSQLTAVAEAKESGLMIQLLPLRPWLFQTVRIIKEIEPEMVISFEDRWGPVLKQSIQSLLQVLKGCRNWKSVVAPGLLFTGSKSTADMLDQFRRQFPQAIEIDTEKSDVVELNFSKEKDLLAWENLDYDFVVDTFHLREFSIEHNELLSWVGQQISSGRVRIVHLQFRKEEEVQEYLTGNGRTYDIVMLFQETKIPLVIELSDVLSSHRMIQKLMHRTRQFIG